MIDTITREQLITTCMLTIQQTEKTHGPLDRQLVSDLYRIAATAPKIAVQWWDRDEQAGCLIGTYRHERGLNPAGDSLSGSILSLVSLSAGLSPVHYSLGINFIGALNTVLRRNLFTVAGVV